MTGLSLVFRGLLYRWRTNLAVGLGAALATAVLVGSLGAGDTVRYSLRRVTVNRLGRSVYALEGGERLFRAAVAGETAAELDGRAAALLALRGAASLRGGEVRVSGVQVLGVESDFWALGPAPATGGFRPQGGASTPEDPGKRRIAAPIGEEEVLLNEPLARRLGAVVGDEILLRVHAPSLMPGEAPLAVGGDAGLAIRLTVAGLVPEESFGDFGLRVSQVPPLNAFVAREPLAKRLERPGRANVLLLEAAPERSLADAQAALTRSWTLADAGLALQLYGSADANSPPGTADPNGFSPARLAWELTSERVFLEPPAAQAALAAGGAGVLTYFVDRLSSADKSIVYSFVSAPGPGRLDPQPADEEIVLNAWAARELEAGLGDTVELEYRVPGPGDRLAVGRERLRVSAVVGIERQDRTLMPQFPGLAGAESCRDWDPGFAIDFSLIGPRDEAYWEAYRGSPRGFVSLATARRLWGNRFGDLTAVRFPAAAPDPGAAILAALPPSSLGVRLIPARELGLEAARAGVDFGTLFLGLSMFLVAAALLLTALLFLLSIEQRRSDIGLLAALGFPGRRIRALLLGEGALVCAAGALLGLPLGLAFHRGVLAGLQGAWQGAVRTSLVYPYVAPPSLLIGFAAGTAAALSVIALSARGTLRRPPGESLRGAPDGSYRRGDPAPDRRGARPADDPRPVAGSRRRPRRLTAALAAAAAAASLLSLLALAPPASFFAAGALLLASWLTAIWLLLAHLGRPRTAGLPSVALLGLENAARRRTRSLAVAALLACGIFVVTAVAANRRETADPMDPASGTGGFAFVAETAVPLVEDPAHREGRERYGLAGPGLEGVGIVSFRVLDGDDASCLNLNRVREPRLLGVDPGLLAGRFSFVAFDGEAPRGDPWSVLFRDLGPNAVAAVADQTVIRWGLGLAVGDELVYRSEAGESLTVRLVAGLDNSIFQGNLIVADSRLLDHFPSASGRRWFLIDVPGGGGPSAEIESAVNRALTRFGVSLSAAADRLAEFDSVENTYLAIFALLGWLGMLVGTLGLGIVVARNVAQSRSELALLRALGLRRGTLLRVVLAEHLPPLGLGLAGGAAASALAVVPALGRGLPAASLLPLLAATLAGAVACTALAAALAVRADLLPALRNE